MSHRRLWASLGTQSAVRVISVMMLIYLLVIGFLVVGYSRVSSCLADYANKSAVSTNARANASAQDRTLDLQERQLDEADRKANRDFSKALSAVLNSFNESQAERKAAYVALLAQDKKTSIVLDQDQKSRAEIQAARAQNEEARKSNPIPPPPSESC